MQQWLMASLLCLMLMLVSGGVSLAEDKNVKYFGYRNCGAYTVSDFWVKWKIDGKKHSKKFTRDVTNVNTKGLLFAAPNVTCFDLEAIGVPQGAEVWLAFQIALGDKEGCRKDNTKFFYDSASKKQQLYKSKGTTLQNNRCRLSDYARGFGCIKSTADVC